MTPGSLVLLGFPPSGPHDALYDALRKAGHHLVVPGAAPEPMPEPGGTPAAALRYVAGAALEIGGSAPRPPLVLVAYGMAGPLLPPLGAAQRAAHRMVGGGVLVDADLPTPAGDWPDAPCGYLATRPDDPRLDAARLRAWRTARTDSEPAALAAALLELIADL
jgi:hypothetical protein